MKIFHFSDIHGQWDKFLSQDLSDIDVVVNSGDFMPNATRGEVEREKRYQRNWFLRNRFEKLIAWLGNRPFISVMGNHDYYSAFTKDLKIKGVDAHLLFAGESVDILGKRFAGFGEIPYLVGEWNGETQQGDFGQIINRVMDCNPDILISHAPAAGVLDYCPYECGIKMLTGALFYGEHKIKLVMSGHCHPSGGMIEEQNGIKFVNSATTFQVVEI